MGVEDILLEAADENDDEYDNEFEEFEHEESGKNKIMSLKEAAAIVDMEDQYDAGESLQKVSRSHQMVTRSKISLHSNDENADNDESIEAKLRKADAKTNILHIKREKKVENLEDIESECESDEDEDGDYEDAKDFRLCCFRRRIDEVYRHLERGASVRATDQHGWSPLHWACAKGHDDIVEILLKEYRGNVKKCINQKDDLMGFTPLHLACVGGHINCIRILFDYKAKKLRSIFGELPTDVISVSMRSPAGRKIAKIFGIDQEYSDYHRDEEAKDRKK